MEQFKTLKNCSFKCFKIRHKILTKKNLNQTMTEENKAH